MRQNRNNTADAGNRILGRIVAEKKKTVMAVCLITLMVFMWVRVLIRKEPSSAQAAMTPEQQEQENKSKSALNVSYTELPRIAGRNDMITRNFFVSNGWQDFEGKSRNIVSIEEVNVVPSDGSEKTIKKVVEKIKLEAILIGENAKAYINDKVLSVGDRLLISDGTDKYECEVVVIEENSVVIRCGEAEVKLKLRPINENKNQ